MPIDEFGIETPDRAPVVKPDATTVPEPSLLGDQQESDSPEAPDDRAEPDYSKEKPWSRADKRIKQLVGQKNDAFKRVDELNSEKMALLNSVNQLTERLTKVEQSQNVPKSDWDRYSEKDLLAMEAEALNPNSQTHSTPLAVQIREELMQRRLSKMEASLRSQQQDNERLASAKQRVLAETISALPDRYRAEIANESSEIRQRAERYYGQYIQEHGKDEVVRRPEYERASILRAYADMSAKEPVSRNENGAPRGRMKEKEQLLTGGENAVRNTVSPKARFAAGDVDGGLAAMPGIRALMDEAEAMMKMRGR